MCANMEHEFSGWHISEIYFTMVQERKGCCWLLSGKAVC